MNILKCTKTGLFAAGVLFGTAGIKILTSKDAKNVYTECTAAVLRAKDFVMKTVDNVQANVEDIYADAVIINEIRSEEDAFFEDEEDVEDAEEEVVAEEEDSEE